MPFRPSLRIRTEVAAFERLFAAHACPANARGQKAYLKSDLEFHGVTSAFVRETARAFTRAHPDLDRRTLAALVEALWLTPYHDLRWLGVALLERRARDLMPADLPLVERLLRRSTNWDQVDWLATRIAGPVLERHPRAAERLDRWARDRNFWLRRAAMLSLLLPIRRGGGDFPRFASYASRMVGEKEFFIRKAIGWVLREASKKRPAIVYAFLAAHRDRVSGLTLREGAKYLPARMKRALAG